MFLLHKRDIKIHLSKLDKKSEKVRTSFQLTKKGKGAIINNVVTGERRKRSASEQEAVRLREEACGELKGS